MKKTAKIVFLVIAFLLLLVAITIYFNVFRVMLSEPTEVTTVSKTISETTSEMVSKTSEIASETVSTDNSDGCIEINTDFLLPYSPYDDELVEGLQESVRRFDPEAMTVIFDGMKFRPGMYARDIIDHSSWYTINENDIVESDSTAFACLENDKWTDGRSDSSFILWVCNYGDKPAALRDCVVYKYQINVIEFSEYPELKYLDYTFGSTDIPRADDEQILCVNGHYFTRYIYGDISACQVFMDTTDDGLMGVTVFCNEYCGPYFNEGGDRNG